MASRYNNRVLKMNNNIMDAKVVEEENRKLYIEREDILEEGSVVRIQNRVFGRRKLDKYWGDELWKVEGMVKGTSAYKIICGDNTRVENRENIKLVVDNVEHLRVHFSSKFGWMLYSYILQYIRPSKYVHNALIFRYIVACVNDIR